MIATLGQIVYIVAFVAAGLWMISAQRDYIRLYSDREGIPSEEDFASEAMRNPLLSVGTSTQRAVLLWRIVWQRQGDPALERARIRVVRRWWVLVAVMLLAGW